MDSVSGGELANTVPSRFIKNIVSIRDGLMYQKFPKYRLTPPPNPGILSDLPHRHA